MAKRTKTDPVFAQIARHRRAAAQFSDVVKRIGEKDDETSQDKRDYERANRAEVRAMAAFLVPPPTTIEGLQAAILYLAERDVAAEFGLTGSSFRNPFTALALSPALRKHGEGEART
jgi:hypothetical protein